MDDYPTRSARLELRVSPEFKLELQKAAEAENRSLSNYIITVLEKALKEGNS